jgi:hypothetical protein
MRTPAGLECKYFYGDYFRGRNHEECNLLKSASINWRPDYCKKCPVPSILMANACEFMVLSPRVARPVTNFFKPQVEVTAFCQKTNREVKEPHIGCGECHPLNFMVKNE